MTVPSNLNDKLKLDSGSRRTIAHDDAEWLANGFQFDEWPSTAGNRKDPCRTTYRALTWTSGAGAWVA